MKKRQGISLLINSFGLSKGGSKNNEKPSTSDLFIANDVNLCGFPLILSYVIGR